MFRAFALYLGGPGYEYHFGDRPLVFFVGFLSHRRYLARQYRKRVLQLGSKLLQSRHASQPDIRHYVTCSWKAFLYSTEIQAIMSDPSERSGYYTHCFI